MEVIYGLIPGMLILGMIAVGILFWAARSGQYDDMEGEAHRILMDEDLDTDVAPKNATEEDAKESTPTNPDQRMPD